MCVLVCRLSNWRRVGTHDGICSTMIATARNRSACIFNWMGFMWYAAWELHFGLGECFLYIFTLNISSVIHNIHLWVPTPFLFEIQSKTHEILIYIFFLHSFSKKNYFYEKSHSPNVSFLLFRCIRTSAWQPSTHSTYKECSRRYFNIRGSLFKHIWCEH